MIGTVTPQRFLERGAWQTTRGVLRPRRPAVRPDYYGPFRVIPAHDYEHLEVEQGYVYAGDGKAWADFPTEYGGPSGMLAYSAGDEALDVSGYADGDYLLCMQVQVSNVNGEFTASYHPHLIGIPTAGYGALQSASSCAVILARFSVALGQVSFLQQSWHGDIYLPVANSSGTYACTWET